MNNLNYNNVYNDFWKGIIENDRKINKEQLKKELCDFYFINQEVSKVYSHVTKGTLSKPLYSADTVISLYDEIMEENYIDKQITEDDLKDMIERCDTKEKLVEELKDYFELGDNV